MDLLQLKYFQTLARLEHMTKAAHELQIAQPALSVTLARLENDLGVTLFDRTGRSIVLNKYGKAFLQRTNKVLMELAEGRQEIADLAGSEYGSLSVTSVSLHKHFCDLLGGFAQLYPKINFRITQIVDDEVKLHLLETGESDFSFINTPIQQNGIVSVPLMKEEIFLAVAPTHRFARRGMIFLSELAEEPFITLKVNHSLRAFCDALCHKGGFTPKIVCECDEPAGIVNLVAAGLGVSFFLAAEHEKQDLPVKLLRIKDINEQSVLQLVWKEKKYFSKAAVHFREYVIQHCTEK